MTAMLTMLSRRIGLAAAVLVPVIFPVLAQDFGEQSMKPAGPPVENHPKMDEKAYKAALENPAAQGEIRSLGNCAPVRTGQAKSEVTDEQ